MKEGQGSKQNQAILSFFSLRHTGQDNNCDRNIGQFAYIN